MLFSIVTVCLNSEKHIADTMHSVLSQTYRDFEYLIIDGASTDTTCSVVEQNLDDRVFFLSEKDNGIYEAMNKAISLAKGKYIVFMNSGDMFYDDTVLEKVANSIRFDVIYGNTYIRENENKVLTYPKLKANLVYYLLRGEMVCHQSIVVSTELMKKHPFELKYRICADRDFFVWCLKSGYSFCYLNEIFSSVDCSEGLSYDIKNINILRRETDAILKKYYPFLFYLTFWLKVIVRKFK